MPMTRRVHIPYIVTTLALVASSACVEDSDAAQAAGRQAQRQRPQSAAGSPRQASDSVRFVEHSGYIRPGLGGPNPGALRLASPFGGDQQVVTLGSQLYLSYNCIDCHGMDGSGAMGPSLADGRWRYGGTPGEVFESIYQGRPDGMPAWGGRISNDQIWMLVTYVRSLAAGKEVSTEDFAGKTVERTGH